MPYQTIWFDQYIPAWNEYLKRFKGQPNLKFLELGCFEGRATVWLLQNILTDPTSMITVIDTFEGSPEFSLFNIDNSKIESNFRENIKEFEFKVEIIKGSTNFLTTLPFNFYDFIYVDASHRALDVLFDGVLAFNCLKNGGSIIFDDYNWDIGKGEKERPHEAIASFIRIWGGFYGKWQFWGDQAAFTKTR